MNGFKYHNPVKIEFGIEKLKKLSDIVNNRKALLVTSNSFTKRGITDKIKGIVNVNYTIDNIIPNPTFDYLEKNYNALPYKDFDVIVALGGGSVIDSAKVFSVYCNNKDQQDYSFLKKLIKQGFLKKHHLIKPVIAVPTTAGTGSEVTPWATVWDMDEKKKYSLHSDKLWCEACICDPLLTVSMSKDITIQTGLDAISHSFESIWNKNSNPISRMYAINAAKIIIETLPKLVNDLDNIHYRERMMFAALSAGMSFSNTQTSIAHAISYYITAHKGIPHGIACSFTLPDIIDAVIGKDEDVDSALKDILSELSSEKLRKLYNDLRVATDFKSYGLNNENMLDLKKSLSGGLRINNSIIDIDEFFELIGSK